jgi:ABC-type nitrate/sulfonate/bicarbonate transport system substrate-binding protein
MAYIDKQLEFSDAQAETTAAAHISTNVIDMTTVGSFADGQPIYFVCTVNTTFTSGGSATLEVQLLSDATSTVAVDGSATSHWTSASWAVADLTAGTVLACVPLPMEGTTYEEYLGVMYTIGTAAMTAGKVDAYLTVDPPKHVSYPDGI